LALRARPGIFGSKTWMSELARFAGSKDLCSKGIEFTENGKRGGRRGCKSRPDERRRPHSGRNCECFAVSNWPAVGYLEMSYGNTFAATSRSKYSLRRMPRFLASSRTRDRFRELSAGGRGSVEYRRDSCTSLDGEIMNRVALYGVVDSVIPANSAGFNGCVVRQRSDVSTVIAEVSATTPLRSLCSAPTVTEAASRCRFTLCASNSTICRQARVWLEGDSNARHLAIRIARDSGLLRLNLSIGIPGIHLASSPLSKSRARASLCTFTIYGRKRAGVAVPTVAKTNHWRGASPSRAHAVSIDPARESKTISCDCWRSAIIGFEQGSNLMQEAFER